MPTQTVKRGGRLVHTHSLANPALRLDLSADPWYLVDGQASFLTGLDIREPNSLRPDKGRRTIGAFLPAAEQPATSALTSTLAGMSLQKHTFVARDARLFTTGFVSSWDPAALTITSVGQFTNYTFHPQDVFYTNATASPTPTGPRFAQVVSKTSNDVIVLASSVWPFSGGLIDCNIARGNGVVSIAGGTLSGVKSFAEYGETGGWPSWMSEAFYQQDEDDRDADASTPAEFPSDIPRTKYQVDDQLILSPRTSGDSKFTIYKSSVFYDKSGIWVTNGRKFWLLQDSVFIQYMDMGDDAYLGQRWSVAQISDHMLMFVTPKFPPRVLSLNAEPSTKISGTETHAGLFTPLSTPDLATKAEAKGWRWTSTTGGSIDGQTNTRIKIRAVNLDDSLASEFVDVPDTNGSLNATTTTNDKVTVFNDPDAEYIAPVSSRASHIEVWRNITGPASGDVPVANYHLETRMLLCQRRPYGNENTAFVGGGNQLSGEHFRQTPAGTFPCTLSDSALASLDVLTQTEVDAHGLPPICQQVVSLLGVTICAGRADSDVSPKQTSFHSVSLKTNAQYNIPASFASMASIWGVGPPWNGTDDQYTNATFYVNVLEGGTAGVPLGRYEVASFSSGDVILKEQPLSVSSNGCMVNLEWPLFTEYPVVKTDEDVWYSRTDKFAPESFPLRTLQLSRNGDIFRNMVVVGNYAAVIMSNGVHLLYFVGTSLARDTIANTGFGTPWAYSVVVIGAAVLWATPNGPKIMVVSNTPDQQGHRGVIQDLDKDRGMRKWFREAYNKDYEIDAGVDLANESVRWRRKVDDNTFEVLQYYWGDDRWASFDGDNGVAYASTTRARSSTSKQAAMFSVTQEGGVFEVNSDGIDEPYANIQPQVITTNTWTVGETYIQKLNAFVPGMTGDVVRFRSSTKAVNGEVRVIRKATSHRIDFDSVPELAVGDEIIIGGVHLKIRWAPLAGVSRRTVKTLEAVTIRLLPTEDENNAHIDMRLFEDFETEPATEEKDLQLHDPDDPTRTTADSTIDLRGQGLDLELELEAVGTKHAFRVEKVLAEVTEEADTVDDTSTEV